MNRDRRRAAALVGISLTLSGCDDPLAEAQIIEATRVLGARVTVEGDPERAWPRPGERARVSWLLAAPWPSPSFGWAFSVCVAAPTTQGVPACAAPPFAELASEVLGQGAPELEFVAPDEGVLGGAARLLVQGAVCAGERPMLAVPLERTHCAGERRLAVLSVDIDRDAGNRNPSLGDETLTFAGNDWPEPGAEWLARADCADTDASASLPLVTANGPEPRIAVRLSETDREPVRRFDEERLEELWLSHFTDRGRLERALSVIEPGSTDLTVSVSWRPPRRVEQGLVARFYFVARDLRGGADWVVRTACVVP